MLSDVFVAQWCSAGIDKREPRVRLTYSPFFFALDIMKVIYCFLFWFLRSSKFLTLEDPVLSIMHCALQKSAAIFLMLKNPVGLIGLCNPLASAMSVVKRLFMYLIY